MKRLTSIVAANCAGAIGVGNELPWKLKTDLRFFKNTTRDSVVIMGRKTFDSLGRKPLPGRTNIVLSHFNLSQPTDSVHWAVTVAESLALAESLSKKRSDAFIIGGAVTYAQFAPFVDRYLISLVDKEVSEADTFLDISMFGDESEWDYSILDTVAASDSDECSFEIIELTRCNARSAQDHRRMVATDYAKAAGSGASKRFREIAARAFA